MYPKHVELEFCHKYHIWRAFDGTKIVMFNEDKDAMMLMFPERYMIPASQTKAERACLCRCDH